MHRRTRMGRLRQPITDEASQVPWMLFLDRMSYFGRVDLILDFLGTTMFLGQTRNTSSKVIFVKLHGFHMVLHPFNTGLEDYSRNLFDLGPRAPMHSQLSSLLQHPARLGATLRGSGSSSPQTAFAFFFLVLSARQSDQTPLVPKS